MKRSAWALERRSFPRNPGLGSQHRPRQKDWGSPESGLSRGLGQGMHRSGQRRRKCSEGCSHGGVLRPREPTPEQQER